MTCSFDKRDPSKDEFKQDYRPQVLKNTSNVNVHVDTAYFFQEENTMISAIIGSNCGINTVTVPSQEKSYIAHNHQARNSMPDRLLDRTVDYRVGDMSSEKYSIIKSGDNI